MANKCKSCNAPIDHSADKCEYCGATIEKAIEVINVTNKLENIEEIIEQAIIRTQNNKTSQSPPLDKGDAEKPNLERVNSYRPTGVKSKYIAGFLALFFGFLGVHRFYLGFYWTGLAQLVLSFATINSSGMFALPILWGFFEAILIITGTVNKDAVGRPLLPDHSQPKLKNIKTSNKKLDHWTAYISFLISLVSLFGSIGYMDNHGPGPFGFTILSIFSYYVNWLATNKYNVHNWMTKTNILLIIISIILFFIWVNY